MQIFLCKMQQYSIHAIDSLVCSSMVLLLGSRVCTRLQNKGPKSVHQKIKMSTYDPLTLFSTTPAGKVSVYSSMLSCLIANKID